MKSFNEHTLICEVNPDTFIPSLTSIDFDITGTYSEIDSTQSLIQTSKNEADRQNNDTPSPLTNEKISLHSNSTGNSIASAEYKRNRRKTVKVNELLFTLPTKEKSKVLNVALKSDTMLAQTIAFTSAKTINEGKALSSLIDYLKNVKFGKTASEFYEIIFKLFGNNINDESFTKWLANSLQIRTSRLRERLFFWNDKDFIDYRGKNTFTAEQKQIIYDEWKCPENAIYIFCR